MKGRIFAGTGSRAHAFSQAFCRILKLASSYSRDYHKAGNRKTRIRRIVLEGLEPRFALSAAGTNSLIQPRWFQHVAPLMDAPTAEAGGLQNLQSWIVQLKSEVAAQLSSVNDSLPLFSTIPGAAQVVRGLGSVGQVLIQTWDADNSAVEQWLSQSPTVESFSPDRSLHIEAIPNDSSFTSLWGLHNTGQSGGVIDADIDAPEAWDITTGSSSIVVAVIDTGIDYNHPDLLDNIWTNPWEVANGVDDDGNGFIDDLHGWDFYNNDNNPLDDNNHGTHCAGTIGGVGNNNLGVAGVNWDVSLMAMKFLGASGNGSDSGAISSLNYVAMMRERGVDVRATSNSYGGGGFNSSFRDAITANRDAGILFVAAAGNNSSNNDTVANYPSNYAVENVIAVAATTRSDGLAGYSNFGVTQVDLGAPGSSILSTTRNNTYSTFSGTSMATPHVAGVAALAWSLVEDASYVDIRNAILASVDPIPALTGKVATGGRLNAKATLDYLLNNLADPPSTYLAAPAAYESLDLQIGGPGVITVVDNTDDAAGALDLGTNSLTLFGTTYTGSTSMFVSANGIITFGTAFDSQTSALNTNLVTTPTQAAIAPYWDDLRTDLDAIDIVLARFDETTGDTTPDRLVIEWSDVAHYPSSSSPVTFQAILELNTGTNDGQIVFNYVDLNFSDSLLNNGRSATIGVKSSGQQSANRWLVSLNNGSHPWIGSNSAILLDRTRPTANILDVTPDPRSSGVSTIDIVFSEPIDPLSFDYQDLTLTRNGGANLITSAVTTVQIDSVTWQVSGLQNITDLEGSYDLTLAMPGIDDAVGHMGVDSVVDSWQNSIATTPDLRVTGLTTDGLTTLTLNYEIDFTSVSPFEIGIFRSADELAGDDQLLTTISIDLPADRDIGSHTKSWTIGSAPGNIALPGAGAVELDSDYFLLATLDPDNVIAELDLDAANEDNSRVFVGVYHAPASDVFVHGSTGSDTVTVNGSSTKSISLNGVVTNYSASDLTSLRVRTHAGADSIDASSLGKSLFAIAGDGPDSIIGSAVSDVLWAGAGADVIDAGGGNDILSGEGGNDQLTGGADDDTYLFAADTQLGTDTLNESGGGKDTLDFTSTQTGVVVDLSNSAAQTVNANLILTLGAATAIENVTGGNGNDTLTGNSLANTLIGNGGDDSLSGGKGNDTYVFDADDAIGTDTIAELSSSGTDLLDFSPTTLLAITVNLSQTNLQVANVNLSLILAGGNNIENVTGGSMNDNLTGNNSKNALTGGPGDDLLAGGKGNDTYLMDVDGQLGTDTIRELAAGGVDKLDFSSTTSNGLTIDLSITGVQVVHSNLSINLENPTQLEDVIGSTKNDVIHGNDVVNVLDGNGGEDSIYGGPAADTLIGGAGDDNLDGEQGDDVYKFDVDSALGSDTLTEVIGAGIDTLDFSLTTKKTLSVDLSSATAQVVQSNLTITLIGSDFFENIIGGSSHDTLTGNDIANLIDGGKGNDIITGLGGNDTLVGGAGTDTLRGGAGRDFLIGGTGTDSIEGGDDDDLLVSGTISYLSESKPLNRSAIDSVMAEWSRLDADYATRISNLRNGGGVNGTTLVNAATVLSDGTAIDTLTGENGQDWFWAFGGDIVTDLNQGGPETQN